MSTHDFQANLGDDCNLVNGLVRSHPDCDNVIFEHSTVQQFFGAFYFIHDLKMFALECEDNQKEYFEIVLKALCQTSPLMKKNPYFVQFCTWISHFLHFKSTWMQIVPQCAFRS